MDFTRESATRFAAADDDDAVRLRGNAPRMCVISIAAHLSHVAGAASGAVGAGASACHAGRLHHSARLRRLQILSAAYLVQTEL